ncbi:hypothetical protein BUZ69_13520 [Staphylococcus saprophyticus]|uniref:hypothetical protein n=1 Tax=Staphylococcus saprophyticus TaxID=29385 RepID=UPI000D1F34BD|nr:hypothetical protein [Staphylococcus saprophyticus]PTK43119.1 hypothetical protein BUZ69_13520 [Staphylococcus saprophyticus]
MTNYEDDIQEEQDNFTKENYITCINLMLGLTKKETERLEAKSLEEVKKAYKLALLENTDELLT